MVRGSSTLDACNRTEYPSDNRIVSASVTDLWCRWSRCCVRRWYSTLIQLLSPSRRTDRGFSFDNCCAHKDRSLVGCATILERRRQRISYRWKAHRNWKKSSRVNCLFYSFSSEWQTCRPNAEAKTMQWACTRTLVSNELPLSMPSFLALE